MTPLGIASTTTLPATKAQKIKLFFRDPCRSQSGPPGYISTLYLLRNDMKTMRRVAPIELLWFRAMGVLTGIDLVSKHYDSSPQQKDRFVAFLGAYMFDSLTSPRRTQYGEAIYYFRNALLHSLVMSGSWSTLSRRKASKSM